MMVPGGRFESEVEYIRVIPEPEWRDEFFKKYGTVEVALETEKRPDHMENFLACVRSRELPILDAETAYKAMVTVGMSVESYRRGLTLYFDPLHEMVIDHPLVPGGA